MIEFSRAITGFPNDGTVSVFAQRIAAPLISILYYRGKERDFQAMDIKILGEFLDGVAVR